MTTTHDPYELTGWAGADQFAQDFTTPSGQKCLVRQIQLEDMIELDMMDKFDILGAAVQTEHIDRVKGRKKPADRNKTKRQLEAEKQAEEARQLRDMMKDKKQFGDLMDMMNKLLCLVVVKPSLTLPLVADPEAVTAENPEGIRKLRADERVGGTIYVDGVSVNDRMAIFNFAMGEVQSMENFREGPKADVEPQGPVEGSPDETE